MAFFKSVSSTTTTAIVAACAIPLAFALSSSSRSVKISRPQNLHFLSHTPITLIPNRFGLVRSLSQPHTALQMAGPTSEEKPSSQVWLKCNKTQFFIWMKNLKLPFSSMRFWVGAHLKLDTNLIFFDGF